MDVVKFKAFYTVATLKNISKAAEQLYYTQPAVSAQIRELENSYGTRLFRRIGQNLELTEAGTHLLPYAEQLLELFEKSRKTVSDVVDVENHCVRIGASSLPGTYLVPQLIVDFQRHSPASNILLTVKDAYEIEQLILAGEVDVGILGRAGASHRTTRFVQEALLEDPLVVVVSPDHPLAGRDHLLPEDLDGYPLIMPPENRLTRRAVEKRFRRLGMDFKPAFEITDTEAIKRMVMHNLGITILSRMVCEREAAAGWLKQLDVEGLDLRREVYLVHQPDRYLVPAVQSFVKYVSERFAPAIRKSDGAGSG
ncbi:MAG: LysR family transcriptional regulator [Spirochaetaceae bacterium]|nr:MAG: LysR family transcriptional regulator [Spirochaetaceae bacterium]